LKPLFDLRDAENLAPAARGIAFRLAENFGTIDRAEIAEEVRGLDQDARAGMRALGVRFGAHHIYVPALLKPGPSALLATFWVLKHGGFDEVGGLTTLAATGRTSVPVDPAIPAALYRVVGYRVAGNMAIRLDILERLADLIRPLIAWRPTPENPQPPEGAVPGNGFTVTVAMTSLLGCSGEDFSSVLRALGYRMERKPKPPEPEATPEAAPEVATAPATPEDAPAGEDKPAEETVAAAPETTETAEPAAAETEPAPEEPTADTAADAPVAEAEPVAAPETPAEPLAGTTEAPDATDAAPPATATAEAAAPEEPAFIEIWRPQRSGRPAGRHGRPESRPEGRPERRPERQARTKPDADGPAGHGRPEQSADGDNAGRKHRQRKPQRGDRKAEGQRGGKERPPPASRPPREKTADPNSPFAALAALKAQLESRDRDG
ncbi:MAG: helicase, partial [Bauldia sp.]|nr:helicase [Bauldia sp.]